MSSISAWQHKNLRRPESPMLALPIAHYRPDVLRCKHGKLDAVQKPRRESRAKIHLEVGGALSGMLCVVDTTNADLTLRPYRFG